MVDPVAAGDRVVTRADMTVAVPRAVERIRSRCDSRPVVGLILGTGLGGLAASIEIEEEFAYREIPGFPRSTALSHAGRLVFGRLAGQNVVAMVGRCHLYEGYTVHAIALPVHVMAALGCQVLVVSNASGGVNPRFQAGDVMAIDSHIDLMFHGPMMAGSSLPGTDRVARRSPFDDTLLRTAQRVARQAGVPLHQGVYVAVSGPNYETRAEYRCFRKLGGDVVGMSTAPEVAAAGELGMRVLALSAVANVALPDVPAIVDAQEVVDVVELASPRMRQIVLGVLSGLSLSNEPT